VKDEVKPFLEKKGIPVFGILPKDKFLESVTVASLNEILNGTVLCCEDRLDEFVENFLIGAMTWTAPSTTSAGRRTRR